MRSLYDDKVLRCRDCQVDFIWTAGEQAFYASKNLAHQPSRCPACRTAARARQASGVRQFFPAVCDRCGGQTQVPFLPRADRPVYCSACYDAVRAGRVLG